MISGFSCSDCDITREVTIVREGERVNGTTREPPTFAYPGTVRDTEGKLVASSRLFLGSCTARSDAEGLQVARVLQANGRLRDEARFIVLGQRVIVREARPQPSLLAAALRAVAAGTCFEIPADDTQVSV